MAVKRFPKWAGFRSHAVGFRIVLQRLGLAVAIISVPLQPPAAQTPESAPLVTPAAAPDQSSAIPLRKFSANELKKEQWQRFHGELIVRNVLSPTLMPVLPDPAKATGAAVIVAPGGAFLFLSMESEGYEVANWLAQHGVAAFVLKYRTRETPRDDQSYLAALGALMHHAAVNTSDDLATPSEAVEDGLAALRLVRKRAAEWRVNPTRVGFLGFSAGAMTTLSVGLAGD